MIKNVIESIKGNNERGSRRQVIEELFYDFNSSRRQVYWINFVRGLFFGFGTVLGGTVFVALIIWVLIQFAGMFPAIGDLVNQIVDAMQRSK